jgi:cytoskeletal protein RodZ
VQTPPVPELPPQTQAESEHELAPAEVPARPGWSAQLSSILKRALSSTRAKQEPEALEPEPPESSQEIFIEIGRQLRQRRELLSLTHDEIEQHIHVRAEFLKALEDGAFEQLPSPVQSRGMLANYAGFLDFDVDTLMLRFADALQQGHRERHPQPAPRTRSPLSVSASLPPLRTFIAGDMVFGVGAAVLLAIFAIWGVGRVMTLRAQLRPNATAPAIPAVVVATAAPTVLQEVTLIPAEDTPLAAFPLEPGGETATLNPDVNLQVNIVAVELTYMRVTVDGTVVFNGRVVPGSAYPFEAEQQIEILTGSAAALRVIYNGQDLGLMGNFGQVIDRVYTARGVVTPTSTQPPTATPTPNYTRTPTFTPSATPTLTRTPTP